MTSGSRPPGLVEAGLTPLEVTARDDHWELLVCFDYADGAGRRHTAQARLLVPLAAADTPVGLVLGAGYEQPVEVGLEHVARGWAHVTPVVPEAATDLSMHPLCRGPNLDVALLHRVRSTPWVDLARIVLTGGSAGGYQALLLAAESLPVMAVEVDAPVLDLGHVVGHLVGHADDDPEQAPVLTLVAAYGTQLASELEADWRSPIYRGRSPLGVLPAITTRVSLVHSTADVLVPLDALDGRPSGSAVRPMGEALLDLLSAEEVELRQVPLPAGAPPATADVLLGRTVAVPVGIELPWAPARWTVTVVQEGAPALDRGHFAHALFFTRPAPDDDDDEALVAQLTAGSLELLMRRLLGRPWMPGPSPLDDPEHERADVLRGLAVVVAAGGSERLRELYAALPAELRALGEDPVQSLASPAPVTAQARR